MPLRIVVGISRRVADLRRILNTRIRKIYSKLADSNDSWIFAASMCMSHIFVLHCNFKLLTVHEFEMGLIFPDSPWPEQETNYVVIGVCDGYDDVWTNTNQRRENQETRVRVLTTRWQGRSRLVWITELMSQKNSLTFFSCFFFVLPLWASAEESVAYDRSEVLFARRIAPLLREKCVACHGERPDEIEGGIDLRSLQSAVFGGDSEEPGIVPGSPEKSSIYLAAARGEESFSAMPPKEAEKLSGEQLEWLREWIQSGAKWPSKERQNEILTSFEEEWSAEDGVAIETSGGLSSEWTGRKYDPAGLWAYQPLRDIEFSEVELAEQNPIDALIEDALPRGLEVAPAPPAVN